MGVEGFSFFLLSQTQRIENSGAQTTIVSALTDWYHVAGNGFSSMPYSVRSVFCWANTFRDDPACSNAVQKKMFPKNASTRITSNRWKSIKFRGRLASYSSRLAFAISAGVGSLPFSWYASWCGGSPMPRRYLGRKI